MNRRLFGIGVLAAAAVLLVVYSVKMKNGTSPSEGAMCTADAMQCPDGSWVGRSGPNCQFVCPIATTTPKGGVLLETRIGKGASGLDVTITPLSLIEDSRCPKDVQCIQAGTVRIRAQITSGLGTATETITLNTPLTTEAEEVTLVAVSPEPESSRTIKPGDYRFVWRVVKR